MSSEPCPLPSMGSDEESFVVCDFDESPNEENKDPGGASIVQEAPQQLMMDESTSLPAKPQVQENFNTDPLFCSCDLSSEEVQNKFSQIIEENICLKDYIIQNNMSMKYQYERIVAWQADVGKVHKAHKEEFKEAKDYIEMLKQENYNLKQELHTYQQQVEEQNNERTKVYEELNTLKDKERFANEKLVKSSDENLKELELDAANKKVKDLENALVNITLERTNFADKNNFTEGELDAANNKIKELETALDNLRLENAKLKEDNVQFNERNDKLQNTEKQIEALNSEISALKMQNEEAKLEIFKVKSVETEKQKDLAEQLNSVKSELHNLQQRTHEELAHIRQQLTNSQVALTESEKAKSEAYIHIKKLNVEFFFLKERNAGMFALQTQLNVYKSDFDAERNAKEAIKTEKDKLSEDLQHLQRRNEQLQEEIELLRKHGDIVHANHVTSSGPWPSSSSSSSGNRSYTCPKCNFAFYTIQALENHVYRCIELDDHI